MQAEQLGRHPLGDDGANSSDLARLCSSSTVKPAIQFSIAAGRRRFSCGLQAPRSDHAASPTNHASTLSLTRVRSAQRVWQRASALSRGLFDRFRGPRRGLQACRSRRKTP
jgi:hypothetical protein